MSSGGTADDRAAAFFDVDGTLTNTTIVHYYVYFRRRRMSRLWGIVWYAIYMVKCVYFLIIDKFDRSLLNVIFYRSYAGLPAAEIKAQAEDCDRDLVMPRQYEQTAACVQAHHMAQREVVFVTGSIDFTIAPLAKRLGVKSVVAPALLECEGRFSGELDGAPVGQQEKARRVMIYSSEHGIDLARSYAYGDSIADLPMLELVGHPQVVNPDRALAAIAKRRGWPIHKWTTAAESGRTRP
jgi:HAD superfamily hydrolase (TIGR01490 family)